MAGAGNKLQLGIGKQLGELASRGLTTEDIVATPEQVDR